MLRAVRSALLADGPALQLCPLTRRDCYRVFRGTMAARAASSAADQTVVAVEQPAPRPPPPPPPPPRAAPPPRRAWAAPAALALTASLGAAGVYFYRKLSEDKAEPAPLHDEGREAGGNAAGAAEPPPLPASGAAFPEHVEFLVVGAGTAAFAALRALRAARPDARVLLVGEEHALPYMRPPLSKEVWRDPELAARAADAPDALTFRQWNGKKRSLAYEPETFYAPVERLGERPGAALARGWRVARLDVPRHEAELTAPGQPPVRVRYDKALVATGVRARRVGALRRAAAAGRSLALRELRDAARLAGALDGPGVRRVAVVGGGFLATELSAALADRLRDSGKEVVQVMAERAPMAAVLPHYLADDAARRLAAAGVTLLTNVEVADSEMTDGRVRMRLAAAGGEGGDEGAASELDADLVVECVGSEMDGRLAAASGLEVHPELGGLLVNAELQARADVFAAGDAACFYDVVLGRRRVEHHDHAVLSGRLAGENMAGVKPAQHYRHQSMFWSDLGPQLGYEAIGIIDSRLPTVGVFSEDAVHTAGAEGAAGAGVAEGAAGAGVAEGAAGAGVAEGAAGAGVAGGGAQYDRGVVLYVRERRVVGVLLWNLFSRMHVARQVLARGEFDDLFEVAKLFAPHDDQ